MAGAAWVPATATKPADGPDCDFALPPDRGHRPSDGGAGPPPVQRTNSLKTWALISPDDGRHATLFSARLSPPHHPEPEIRLRCVGRSCAPHAKHPRSRESATRCIEMASAPITLLGEEPFFVVVVTTCTSRVPVLSSLALTCFPSTSKVWSSGTSRCLTVPSCILTTTSLPATYMTVPRLTSTC